MAKDTKKPKGTGKIEEFSFDPGDNPTKPKPTGKKEK